jgi:predicted enzyme related to lactoylglutathione lyase
VAMNARSPMVIHYVRDMTRAVAFYRDVLGFSPDFRSDGWSTFRCESLTVALHIIEDQVKETVTAHAGLNIEVDDLDAAAAAVMAGGGKVRILRAAGGGVPVRLAEVEDTEGNVFELRQFVGEGPAHTGKVTI